MNMTLQQMGMHNTCVKQMYMIQNVQFCLVWFHETKKAS